MPDAHFAEPRLAAIYDTVDFDRRDLDAYLALVKEFGARSVLDIGCGTGSLACLLAAQGVQVTAIDPAAASIAVARRKPYAERVQWKVADSTALGALEVDMATMTGNVAQVFLTDEEWAGTLRAVRDALKSEGRLVFETRDPTKEAWRDWNPAQTHRRLNVPGAGLVQTWQNLTEVSLPFVSFRTTFAFESDGGVLTSDSTLRFRDRQEVEASLRDAGLSVDSIRDAPDRRGLEFIFVVRHLPGSGPPRPSGLP